MPPRALEVFEDFSGGEWGNIGARKAAKNQFSATNAVVYSSGELGPRPGLKRYTGTAPTSGAMAMVAGNGRYSTGQEVWYATTDDGGSGGTAGIHVRSFDSDNFTGPMNVAYSGSPIAAAPGTFNLLDQWDTSGNNSYFTAMDATRHVYRLQHGSHTLSTFSAAPGARAICRYGNRLIVGNIAGGANNNIQFSAPDAFGTWPVTNFIPIGTDAIAALRPLRNSLVIVTAQHEVWILDGTPSVNEVLRQQLPFYPGQRNLAHPKSYASDVNGVVGVRPDHRGNFQPIFLSGGSLRAEEQLAGILNGGIYVDDDTANNSTMVSTTALPDTGSVVMHAGSTCLLRFNNVWTKHTFGTTPSGSFPHSDVHVGAGRMVMIGGGLTGWRAYGWWPCADKVPIVGDGPPGGAGATPVTVDCVSLGDDSTTPLTVPIELAEVWDKEGREMQVRTVLFDITEYDQNNGGGSTNTNAFTAQLRVLGRFDNTDVDTQTFSYDSGTQNGGSTGADRTVRMNVEPTPGRGFQVRLSTIRALSIKRVTVIGDVDAVRP